MGSLYQEHCNSIEEVNRECESCVHLLKEKYQPDRGRVSKGQASGLENNYKECAVMFATLERIGIGRLHLNHKGPFFILNVQTNFVILVPIFSKKYQKLIYE